MNYGFDIDGVISNGPLGLNFLGRKFEPIVHQLLKLTFLRQIYNKLFRKVNQEIKEIIINLKKDGHKIIIISSINENYWEEMCVWLIENGVLFDKLILRKDIKIKGREYKRRMIEKEKCNYHLDDRKVIVDYINKKTSCLAALYIIK